MSETEIIRSLSKEQATELVKTYGRDALLKLVTRDWAGLVPIGSQVWTDFKTRQTLEEQRVTYVTIRNAVVEFLKKMESKEIRVVQGSFNPSVAFTTSFQSAALFAIPLVLLSLNESIKRVGSALEGISSELASANVAKVQGWENDGFGSHIHRFVRTEMAAVDRQEQHHYFYVWHPDTDWYPTFEKIQQQSPLDPNFGGYHTDLDAICMRMSSDRATLIRTTSYGRDAVFHLLIPAYEPIVISHRIAFHRGLFPLVITGQRHRGVDFAWFNLRKVIPSGLALHCVGVLGPEGTFSQKYGGLAMMCFGLGSIGCATASVIFPPCAPAVASLGVACADGLFGSAVLAFGGNIYEGATSEGPMVLGEPIFV